MVRFLVQAGTDVNATTDRGVTPLQQAAELGRVAVVVALVEAPADVNAGGGGSTALELAEAGGHGGIVDLLRGAGAVG
jgi:ankyrin repeat protein